VVTKSVSKDDIFLSSLLPAIGPCVQLFFMNRHIGVKAVDKNTGDFVEKKNDQRVLW